MPIYSPVTMMRTSPETMDNFVERNQIESVEEIIAAASWKKSSRLRLLF
ncbi:MAG: hypothetical protein ABSD49_15280 [Candidatus Bathyarchaeia archaeon]|jgi:hypothetical protein